LKDLGGHSEAAIARALDPAVHVGVTVVHNEDHEHRGALELVSGRVEGASHHLASFSRVALVKLWALGTRREPTTVALVDLDEVLYKRLNLRQLRHAPTVDDADTPGLDGTLVGAEELLAVEAPATLDKIALLDGRT
jgi:hypothetical protein